MAGLVSYSSEVGYGGHTLQVGVTGGALGEH